jgi:fumarylacetoacetase
VADDDTISPALESWVPVPAGSDFPLQNLPYGVVRKRDGATSVAIAIGDHVLDLGTLQRAGLLDLPGLAADALLRNSLNALMSAGPTTCRAVRRRVSELLRADERRLAEDTTLRDRALIAAHDAELLLPFEIGDYVDFYSSLHHATNMGHILRPDSEPLPPNWRYLPIGYQGRAGTVVVSGTPVRRPHGQVLAPDGRPRYDTSHMLDFELEVGFVVGVGNEPGHRIPTADAADHIFGVVLVNDWSARDIQAFEYQPLGPFLGKSFATSVSPWVVTLDALRPYFTASPVQDPVPAPYLHCDGPWALDLRLEATIRTARMHECENDTSLITRVSFADMYWTMPQQLAHATSNGAITRPGDLFGSGTVSGPEPGSWGSLMEASSGGTQPVTLANGETRSFLEDGDTVTLRGWCERAGWARVGFGEVTGTVVASPGPDEAHEGSDQAASHPRRW